MSEQKLSKAAQLRKELFEAKIELAKEIRKQIPSTDKPQELAMALATIHASIVDTEPEV